MLKLRIKFDGKCDVHPRYDPATTEEGGIKAGCERCYQLLNVWRRATEWRKIADQFLHHVPSSTP